MKISNIFVYIKLTKLTESLSLKVIPIMQQLKLQASYFSIIIPNYFSPVLAREWEAIVAVLKQKAQVLTTMAKLYCLQLSILLTICLISSVQT